MTRRTVRPSKAVEEVDEPSDPMEAALRLLQERWVLPIISALLHAPDDGTGFNDLGRQVRGAHPPILASRLELLERHGIVTKRIVSHMPPRTCYSLSETGLALRPVLEAIKAWASTAYRLSGSASEAPDQELPMSPSARASTGTARSTASSRRRRRDT